MICHDFARKHVSMVSQFHSMEILQAGRTDARAAVAVALAAALLLWQVIRQITGRKREKLGLDRRTSNRVFMYQFNERLVC